MAAAKVVFHPGASEDYAAAFAWYYVRGITIASNFESEIDRGIRLISQNPTLCAGLSLITKGGVSSFANFPIRLSMNYTARMSWFSPSPTVGDDLTTGASAPPRSSRSVCQCPERPQTRCYLSADKDFIVVEGSMTSIGACTNCVRPASEYSNARKNFFDYTAKWINDRFLGCKFTIVKIQHPDHVHLGQLLCVPVRRQVKLTIFMFGCYLQNSEVHTILMKPLASF